MTIGDHLEERTLPVYRCKIKDLKGRILMFFAVALSWITGDMFCPLTGVQLKYLFPKVKEIESMCVTDPVDYLVGLDKQDCSQFTDVRLREVESSMFGRIPSVGA